MLFITQTIEPTNKYIPSIQKRAICTKYTIRPNWRQLITTRRNLLIEGHNAYFYQAEKTENFFINF